MEVTVLLYIFSHLGGMIATNFPLGAVLIINYAKEIAKYMPHVEIRDSLDY